MDIVLVQVFLNPLGECVGLCWVEGVDFAIQDRGGIGFEVYGMIIVSRGWKSLSFCFRKYLVMLSVFLWDCFEVFVLVCFYCPFLSKIGSVNDNFVPFFPFMCPC